MADIETTTTTTTTTGAGAGAPDERLARQERERRWQEEHAAAIDAHNARIETEGLLMTRYFPR